MLAEGIPFSGKKPCCSFRTGLTRLLPCTGASRAASWLFETWFGAAGGGRDGHSSVHSGEGREGNVTGFTTAPLHVHTLGVWGSSRGEVKSMAREETESQTEGIKRVGCPKASSGGTPYPGQLIHLLIHPISHCNLGCDLHLSGLT